MPPLERHLPPRNLLCNWMGKCPRREITARTRKSWVFQKKVFEESCNNCTVFWRYDSSLWFFSYTVFRWSDLSIDGNCGSSSSNDGGMKLLKKRFQHLLLKVVTKAAFDTKRDDALRLKRLKLKKYNDTTKTPTQIFFNVYFLYQSIGVHMNDRNKENKSKKHYIIFIKYQWGYAETIIRIKT